jgi:diguanylate cyclase (GGDEF)-like protein/PAS domain S-box-containing protein
MGDILSEQQRAEMFEHYKQIFDNSTDVMYLIEVTPEGRFIHLDINTAYVEAVGMPREAIIGRYVEEIENAAFRTILLDKYGTCLKAGKKVDYVNDYPLPWGVRTYHSNLSPIRDEEGNIIRIVGIARDITEYKEQEKRLKKTRAKLSAIITTIPDLLWVKDVEGVYMMCNPAFERFFGASSEEIIGKTDYDFISREQADFFRRKDAEAFAAGEMRINEEEIVFAQTGEYALLETRKMPVYSGDEFMGVLGVGRDITERKRLETALIQNQKWLNEAQKIAKVGSWELEFPELKLTWSEEIYRIFELDPNAFHPSYEYFLNLIHPDDRDHVDAVFAESLKHKTPYDLVHRLLMSEGRIKYVHERGETLYDEEGNPIRSIGTVQDITKQKIVEKKIEHLAHHDPLTGLPNRALSKARAEQIIAYAKRSNTKAAFLFIDLDGFKAINDTLGHSAGDAMLKTIATRLKACVRESDIISRLGGDEFLLILSELKDESVIASTTQKILSELEKSFEINDHILSLSGSIGIALYPDHGETFEVLLQSADTAMYKAKESGKNGYHFYTQQMAHMTIGQFKIQNDLKNALQNGEFVLFYQPQIDLATHRITGAEALIRWFHPQLGTIPPMNFIPIAEKSGLIVPIGEWVIGEACRQAALWHSIGIEIGVAVNISAMQFKRGNLEAVVQNALLSSQIDPKWLELELTESILIHDVENTLQSVRNLKALGVQLSIDDFGTGYSSLAYLKRFAVDKLKIDQSFVRDILQDREDAAIVKTIIQMAKNLNLKTIAEGVEDGQVLSVIDAYGCDEVQGYHFAKPMEAKAFEEYHSQFYRIGEN